MSNKGIGWKFADDTQGWTCVLHLSKWTGTQVAQEDALLRHQTALVVRGFESLPVRQHEGVQVKIYALSPFSFSFLNFLMFKWDNPTNGLLVKRLRHCPFTAVSRVRFPYRVPCQYSSNRQSNSMVRKRFPVRVWMLAP